MIAYSAISGTIGMLFVFILNTLMPWRMVAMCCMFVPILTVFALCFVSFEYRTFSITDNFNNLTISHRFPKHLYGYYPKIGPLKLKKRCVGCVVGFQKSQSQMNFVLFNDTANDRNHVSRV